MNVNFIDMMEPTPVLLTKKCKLIALLIRIFLQFSIYPISAVVWYIYGWFIAVLTLFLGFVIIGIIRSKLRNDSIPVKQREYNYNDQGIATWYTAKQFCYPEEVKQ
ncbi:hypothetical protein [Sulfurimonas marina]|uniref:Uncharacterized protein n=1 Tax=Sulfurimonas marina TaxID=2590551 RepID=A0A7M1AW07_9BACT|nr:hypothetical protein [Sulfurimonas marina]QOP41566.1 hypothetical protein FJR03_07320 [Sulfurimonas marina]